MELRDLITLAETYTAFVNRSEATVSNQITTHARFFERIRAGKGCNFITFKKALAWFHENWPADLEWPSDIPRPAPQSKKEAAQ